MKTVDRKVSEFNRQFTPGQSVYLEMPDGTFADAYLGSVARVYMGFAVADIADRAGQYHIHRITHRDGDN